MALVDREALQRILKELQQVIVEIRAFVPNPTNKTSTDTSTVPAGNNVLQLPPAKKWGPNDFRFHAPPGSQKVCKLCKVLMSDIVFFPCQHCVICQDCWKTSYAMLSKEGKPSAYARKDCPRCPAVGCRSTITSANSLGQYKQAPGREDEVKYSKKNEYLGDNGAVV